MADLSHNPFALWDPPAVPYNDVAFTGGNGNVYGVVTGLFPYVEGGGRGSTSWGATTRKGRHCVMVFDVEDSVGTTAHGAWMELYTIGNSDLTAGAFHASGQKTQEATGLSTELATANQGLPDGEWSYGTLFHADGKANALMSLDRVEDALASYDKAIERMPDYAEAHYNRGNALKRLERTEAALASYDRAIAAKPDYAEAHGNRGVALDAVGRSEEAIESFDKAIACKPDFAEAYCNRGNAFQSLGRAEEALASYDRALAAKPDYAEAHNNRGVALNELGRGEEALESFAHAIALNRNYAEAYNNRGNALLELDRAEEALASYDKAIAIRPDYARAYNNRGNALKDLDRLEEGLASHQRAIALDPDYAEAHYNRGNSLKALDRLDEAIESYDAAVKMAPGYERAYYNRGLARLSLGRFESGWQDYEYRWQATDIASKRVDSGAPDWAGEPLSGRHILVFAEQGLGDTIQFARYLPLLRRMGAEVTFLGSKRLFRILRPLTDGIELLSELRRGRRFDVQCALMGLPRHFGADLTNIPAEVPYIVPEAEPAAAWARRLGAEGFKVGIAWQGNPSGAVDVGRSIPLREFRPLGEIPGLRLISLQKQHGLEQLDDLPRSMTVETLGDDFDDGADAFVDTVAVMRHLDLIVTSDTAVAHIGGAMGRPTWVALKQDADWRWLRARADSPWYPTIRIFRQPRDGDWGVIFEQISADAANWPG